MDKYWFLSNLEDHTSRAELFYIEKTSQYVEGLLSVMHIRPDIKCQDDIRASSHIERSPAPSPLHFLELERRETCPKNIESGIFSLGQPLKYMQRKSYDEETRYLRPLPIIKVRYLDMTSYSIFSS